ncbi:hypothetical protein CERSUDRAFT_143432 [Gelatoporia subvermispora B]|uniref:Tetrapyrrole biosynthesis uroporphyrinogen III synthase domain-containing protein n=1 Tax=Ceriporiopsis subvermispora (strain B) TaxID=914234 RepID=M2R1S1_CERS8|nr:hypothetical protein CERSUDRAFT_143432 [Gelatoporia subvermispora B]
MVNVLLLRSTPQDGPDKYEEAFRARGYNPVSVPVLETVLKNIENLRDVILEGPARRSYGGVIVTSARACEAWRATMQRIVKESPASSEQGGRAITGSHSTFGPNTSLVNWSTVSFYVVGEATAKALSDIVEAFPSSPYAPRDVRGAAESGTSDRLANFILEDLKDTSGSRQLLYLTGDKNRDTLPKILAGGGFTLESLQVYETQGSSTFAEDLRQALSSNISSSDRWWLVYFAPSAADFVTPTLREYFALRDVDSDRTGDAHLMRPRIAAIGPTTSTFLRDTLRLHVDVVPPRPSADALVSAIRNIDDSAL